MPNHCDNDLRIRGDKKEIERFFAAVKGDEVKNVIDADKIIPYPKKFKDLDVAGEKWDKDQGGYGSPNYSKNYGNRPKDGFNQGGYEWCIANWGTKWGLYNFYGFDTFDKSACVSFNTAWAPPTPVILAASKLFPKLTFTLRFYERGAAFQGVYKVKNGKVLEDECWEYRGRRGG